MEKALREIIAELAAGGAPDEAWLDRLVRARNREMHDGTRRVAKKRLLPAYLRLREEQPDVLAAWGAPVGGQVDAAVVRLLRAKPRRTASGVATITVLTKPWPCAGDCVFCPNDVRMPKSYLADEPACQRAERCFFDPYLQVTARLRVLQDMGHPTDKVELIVLGGTWSDYPRSYQLWFMCELFRALNSPCGEKAEARRRFYEDCGLTVDPDELAQRAASVQAQVTAGRLRYADAWEQLYGSGCAAWEAASAIQQGSLEELERLHAQNETAEHRCVGLVVETRPEKVTAGELLFLRQLGCTKVQMGVQTLDAEALTRCGRTTDPGQVERAFELLRLFGFKSHIHMMANLPGATTASDAAEFRTLVSDARFRPDELKLYPCCLVESARLGDLYGQGAWQPYGEAELVDLLASDMLVTPPYTRVSRMIRDISATDIVAGNKKTNLRQMVEAEVERRVAAGTPPCQEMRFREIATDEVDASAVRLQTVAYQTTVSEERFLQWVTDDGRLVGFLRLSLPDAGALRSPADEGEPQGLDFLPGVSSSAEPPAPFPLAPGEAMIREVHVYGKVASIRTRDGAAPEGSTPNAESGLNADAVTAESGLNADAGTAQHTGLGRQLVAEACRQAAEAGYHAINVISAVGTREYYRSLGFADAGLYQRMRLEAS